MKKLMTLAALALCAGCVMTGGKMKPAEDGKATTVTFYRFAVLYPFDVESLEFPGGLKIGKWASTGGAAELVPLVDATGKIIGYMAEGAVKGAK